MTETLLSSNQLPPLDGPTANAVLTDRPMTWGEFKRHVQSHKVKNNDPVWLLWDGSSLRGSAIRWDGEVWTIESGSFAEM